MDHKTYMTVTTVIFTLVALLHLGRVAFGWGMSVAGWEVPTWLSWAALLLAAFLAYTGYRQQR